MENRGEDVGQEEETNTAAIHSEAAASTTADDEAIASASASRATFPDESLASTVEALNVQEIHEEEKIELNDNNDDNILETERKPSPLPNGDIEDGRQPRLRAAIPVAHEHAEVEPEVDIEEVVLDQNFEPSVSVLTTSLMDSEKQDIADPPPAIPNRAAFASALEHRPTSEGRGTPSNRHNATASRFASTGAALPLPDFKAQVNSRSFLRVNQDDLRVDGRVVEPDDARTVSVVAQLTEDSSPPVQVAPEPTTRHISNGSSSNQHSPGQQQQDDGDIPVVAAVLVPQERLEAGHRHESGSTALSTNDSVSSQANNNNNNNNNASSRNNNNNDNGGSTSRSKSTRSGSSSNNSTNERRFWITLIIAALVLNSLLVTGVVVASFCAAGKCSAKSESAPATVVTDEDSADGLAVPTPSIALTPTAAPSPQQPSPRMLSDSPTGWSPLDGTSEADPPNNSTAPARAPPTASLPTPQPTEEDDRQRPNEETSAKGIEEEDNGSGVPLVVMEILLALAAEVVILGSLYLYYRWFKKRQRKLQEADQGAGSTTSSCPDLDVGETNDDEEEAERLSSEP